jgi:hypothetical protein
MLMTEEMATAWASFYRDVALKNPANESARGREVLMEFAARLLREAR